MDWREFFLGTPATKASRARALAPAQTTTTVSPRFKDYQSYLGAYKLPWVHKCVSVIAENAANVPYRLVRDLPDGEERDIAISPLLDLLSRPNPEQTGFALFESIWTDLELTGNAFVALEELDGRGRPAEMYRLRPDRVAVQGGGTERVAGYVYTAGGRRVDYTPQEMWHLRYPNPLSDQYGMGMIEAAEARIDSDAALAEFERSFWRSGAKITGILKTTERVDDGTWERIKGAIRQFFTNGGTSAGVLMLENGLEYQSVSDNPTNLGIVELARMNRDQILAIFGVPPTKVGILENANYKATASDEYFWTETIDPKLTRMERALAELVERFHPGQGLRLVYKRLDFTDDRPKAEVAEIMVRSGAYRLNEVRQYLERDELPEGDVVMMPSSLAPFGGEDSAAEPDAAAVPPMIQGAA